MHTRAHAHTRTHDGDYAAAMQLNDLRRGDHLVIRTHENIHIPYSPRTSQSRKNNIASSPQGPSVQPLAWRVNCLCIPRTVQLYFLLAYHASSPEACGVSRRQDTVVPAPGNSGRRPGQGHTKQPQNWALRCPPGILHPGVRAKETVTRPGRR